MIERERYRRLLHSLELGSPVAEDDDIMLQEARVETAVFDDLLQDRIDVIKGTKGSGKSAIYTIFTRWLSGLLKAQRRIVVVKGVESIGDPTFLKYRPQFEQLDEVGFQNFWRIYFLSLINSQFLSDPANKELLSHAAREVARYKRLLRKANFPSLNKKFSLETVTIWALSKLPRPKAVSGSFNPATGEMGGSVDFEQPNEDVDTEPVPIFIADLHEALLAILNRIDLRLWLFLDRLDEAFPRRSRVEKVALRALLRTSLSFRDPRVRMKVFLRDDIFSSITEGDGGFVALTHVMSRCSDTLQWDRDQILHLIINRVCTSEPIVSYFRINKKKLATDKNYRERVFYYVFPDKIRPGKNQSNTLEWITNHSEDANGVVTPRDIIDLVTFAKVRQVDIYSSDETDMEVLLSPAAIVHGHQEMSQKKRETYFMAEFDHLWRDIECFQSNKAEHNEGSLRRMLGDDWKNIVKDLKSIGFLSYNARAGTYKIPFLYRPCLDIRQGRAFKSTKR